MLEELKGGLEAPGCSELLWEEQREMAQLLPVAPLIPASGFTEPQSRIQTEMPH